MGRRAQAIFGPFGFVAAALLLGQSIDTMHAA